MFVHLPRYARVFHRRRREYGHVVAPGPNAATILFAPGGDRMMTPVNRADIRLLTWWERLLNR